MSDLVVRLRLNATNRDFDRGLRADNREAADRIEALEAAQAWRPIETAPKDGTRILLCGDPKRYGVPVHIDHWDEPIGCWHWFGFDADIVGWMPLPQPPGGKHD